MQPLIDCDVLIYECGFAAEAGWKQGGAPPFDNAAELMDNRIEAICNSVGATAPPILFLTGKTNFRNTIAKRTKYKNRPSNKPYHYKNLIAYVKGKYDCRLTEGLEADDCICIEQTSRGDETIICTRDKDLRACPGWHYGWELGNQPSFGPECVEGFGRIQLSRDRKSIKGVGLLFFYSQLLTGDKVDSIPGLEGCGAVKAYETLVDCQSSQEALKACYKAYKAKYGMRGYAEMLEQGRLLWMTRSLHDDGSPKLWGRHK